MWSKAEQQQKRNKMPHTVSLQLLSSGHLLFYRQRIALFLELESAPQCNLQTQMLQLWCKCCPSWTNWKSRSEKSELFPPHSSSISTSDKTTIQSWNPLLLFANLFDTLSEFQLQSIKRPLTVVHPLRGALANDSYLQHCRGQAYQSRSWPLLTRNHHLIGDCTRCRCHTRNKRRNTCKSTS